MQNGLTLAEVDRLAMTFLLSVGRGVGTVAKCRKSLAQQIFIDQRRQFLETDRLGHVIGCAGWDGLPPSQHSTNSLFLNLFANAPSAVPCVAP